MDPTLAICVPTHHGRGPYVAELLDAVAEQLAALPPGRVTVVVADNASRDGTEALVAARRAAGLPVAYHRRERDIGAAANIYGVVELAGATWCWLLGSDDRPAPGALARVLELVAAHPDAVGLTVNLAVLDRELREVADEQPTSAVPALNAVTELRDMDAIVGALGWILSGISCQVVRRDAWVAAADEVRSRPGADALLFPHLAVAIRMATADPRWVWTPEKLAWVRAGNYEIPDSLGRWQARLIRELDRHWRAAAPGRGHREALRRYVATAVRRPAPAEDRRVLLATLAKVLFRHPRFWLRVAPRLLMPPRRAFRRTMPRLEELRAEVAAELPGAMRQADMRWVRCRVRNRGRVPMVTAPEHPVYLASRWRRSDGAPEWVEGARRALPRPLAPGRRVTLELPVVAPWEPGEWELRIGLVQHGRDWFDAHPDGGAAVGRVAVVGSKP